LGLALAFLEELRAQPAHHHAVVLGQAQLEEQKYALHEVSDGVDQWRLVFVLAVPRDLFYAVLDQAADEACVENQESRSAI